jgi:hypothetical protein
MTMAALKAQLFSESTLGKLVTNSSLLGKEKARPRPRLPRSEVLLRIYWQPVNANGCAVTDVPEVTMSGALVFV